MRSWFSILTPVLAVLALLSGFFASRGCGQSQTTQSSAKPQSLPTVKMTLGNREFTIEVAANEEQRQMGLMYRDSMPADHGMIFVFDDEEPLSFWMKNTRIPLDIAYLDRNAKIVSIQSMKPFDLTGIDSGKPAKYAIELNVGVATAAGLHVGDVIKIPAFTSTQPPPTTGNATTTPTTRN